MRPLVERDLITAYRMFVPTTVEIINSGKEAFPMVWFLQMHKQRPGIVTRIAMLDAKLVAESHQSPETKRLLMGMIKATLGVPGAESVDLRGMLAKDGDFDAHIAVQVAEAWVVAHTPGEPLPVPSERPDRREMLHVNLHVRERTYGKSLPIQTVDGRRHCKFVGWCPSDTRGAQVQFGTFSIQQEPLP